jgi:transposase-like protein
MEIGSKYKPERISYRRREVSEFIIDETQIKVGNGYFWLCVVIELNNKSFL